MIMMYPTMFDPIALETWCSDKENDTQLQTELESYLQHYSLCFSNPQKKAFQTVIRGLLSPLERKSIEPIALYFSGEEYVRPLQQFFSRSPFKEQPILEIYQRLLSEQIGSPRGMLSVDDTSFVKKGRHSVGVKRQYCGRLGKTENCQCGVFLAYAGDKGYGLVDYQLYIPQEWFSEPYADLRHKKQDSAQAAQPGAREWTVPSAVGRLRCRLWERPRFPGCPQAPGRDLVSSCDQLKGAGVPDISGDDLPRGQEGPPQKASGTLTWPVLCTGYRQ